MLEILKNYDKILKQKWGGKMNILVLDDEKEIADLVEVYLKNENYNVFKFLKKH